jgi:histidyl-tRNA synthetase
MSDLQPPRGTQDILPPLSERFQAHERLGGEIFERAGYRRIITPMFEDTAVFARGVGEGSDIVSKEMYTFRDRSDNELTLRPEGTAPVIRAIISNGLHNEGLPVKLWYSAAMFRYDRPQKGRYRQHHQLGIEAVGSEDPALDAEVIWIGDRMLRLADIEDFTLSLNSIGHPGCREAYLPELVAFLEAHASELDEDCNRRMKSNALRAFDCKVPADQKILQDAPVITDALCDDCRAHFEAVQGTLKDAGIAYTIAPRLVRGLDYYTRTTFEFQTGLLEAAQSTVCGGGRYDGLSELLGGPRLPGIGFGSGIERILLAQESAGSVPDDRTLDCFIVPLGAEERALAFEFARQLRQVGVLTDIAYVDKSLKAHMRAANKRGARFVAIIGPAEASEGVANVRDMETGEEAKVGSTYAAEWLVAALAKKGIRVQLEDGREPF